MYLRDVLEDLGRRKLRDVVDFEWKRNIRFYGTDNSRAPGKLCLRILVYDEPIQRPAPSWLVSLIGRALHRYRIQAFFSQLH